MLVLRFFIQHVVKLSFCDVLYLCLLYCYSWEFGKVIFLMMLFI